MQDCWDTPNSDHYCDAITAVEKPGVEKKVKKGLVFFFFFSLLKSGETLPLVCSYFLSGDTELN